MSIINAESVRVFARLRPILPSESNQKEGLIIVNKTTISVDGKNMIFDGAFASTTGQDKVYETVCRSMLDSFFQGFNASVIAYGQSGSGKTFTIEGEKGEPGMITRLVEDIFTKISKMDKEMQYVIKVQFMEIYMDKIKDLLDKKNDNLAVVENAKKLPFVKGLSEIFVSSVDETLRLFTSGKNNRVRGTTNMNKDSSRGHTIFIIDMKGENSQTKETKQSTFHLVDLAGTGKARLNGPVDDSASISASLTAFKNVINALVDKLQHVPFRCSKLTRVLQNCLGGNSRTAIIICCNPTNAAKEESRINLSLGVKARSVKNQVVVGQEVTAEEWRLRYEDLLDKYERLKKTCLDWKNECEKRRRGERVDILTVTEPGLLGRTASTSSGRGGRLSTTSYDDSSKLKDENFNLKFREENLKAKLKKWKTLAEELMKTLEKTKMELEATKRLQEAKRELEEEDDNSFGKPSIVKKSSYLEDGYNTCALRQYLKDTSTLFLNVKPDLKSVINKTLFNRSLHEQVEVLQKALEEIDYNKIKSEEQNKGNKKKDSAGDDFVTDCITGIETQLEKMCANFDKMTPPQKKVTRRILKELRETLLGIDPSLIKMLPNSMLDLSVQEQAKMLQEACRTLKAKGIKRIKTNKQFEELLQKLKDLQDELDRLQNSDGKEYGPNEDLKQVLKDLRAAIILLNPELECLLPPEDSNASQEEQLNAIKKCLGLLANDHEKTIADLKRELERLKENLKNQNIPKESHKRLKKLLENLKETLLEIDPELASKLPKNISDPPKPEEIQAILACLGSLNSERGKKLLNSKKGAANRLKDLTGQLERFQDIEVQVNTFEKEKKARGAKASYMPDQVDDKLLYLFNLRKRIIQNMKAYIDKADILKQIKASKIVEEVTPKGRKDTKEKMAAMEKEIIELRNTINKAQKGEPIVYDSRYEAIVRYVIKLNEVYQYTKEALKRERGRHHIELTQISRRVVGLIKGEKLGISKFEELPDDMILLSINDKFVPYR